MSDAPDSLPELRASDADRERVVEVLRLAASDGQLTVDELEERVPSAYAARTRNGFTPRLRRDIFARLRELKTTVCPFANLPEKSSGRWGQGLTAAKMAECQWVQPELVGHFEFVEWTLDNHLRHSRFVGLRLDKEASDVTRE